MLGHYDAAKDSFDDVRVMYEGDQALAYLQKLDIQNDEAMEFAMGIMKELNRPVSRIPSR